MPRYDFECQDCRATFEVQASLSDYAALLKAKKIECAKCGSKKVTRVFSPPAVLSSSSSGRRGGCCSPGCKCR